MSTPIDLATATVSHFEPLLGEKFSTMPADESELPSSIELELVRATPYPLGGADGYRAPFSLFFNGPAGRALGQGVYTMNHPQTGEISLFMVPVARQEDRIQLQAVLG